MPTWTTAGAVTTSTGSDYGTKPNAAPTLVPMAGCVLYFSILVGIVGAGVVFL
ncbi:hypothetical protein MYAM1_003692 [Malassezia yamatoensis]|uniref:Transmembrane protein n=1 Tax=Malassezia yamatoensis TaxID=253288 RepID=A0AAJ5YVC0_9BASI|nr:hypothetical protein MYAM1_003692 [Malassezia yamatoensis]